MKAMRNREVVYKFTLPCKVGVPRIEDDGVGHSAISRRNITLVEDGGEIINHRRYSRLSNKGCFRVLGVRFTGSTMRKIDLRIAFPCGTLARCNVGLWFINQPKEEVLLVRPLFKSVEMDLDKALIDKYLESMR